MTQIIDKKNQHIEDTQNTATHREFELLGRKQEAEKISESKINIISSYILTI